MSDYRKIYEKYYGKIPIDSHGRSYDIHHIDGNRLNNDPTNLMAVTIEEHFKIHYSQSDFYACYLILLRANSTTSEISEISRKNARKMIENGTHPFLGGEMQSRTQKELVKNGTHHLLSGEIQRNNAKRRVKSGIHNFQTMSTEKRIEVQNSRWNEGTHPFQRKNHYDLVREANRGEKNVRYDDTKRHFFNRNTGEREFCTMNALYTKYSLCRKNLCAVVKGKRKTCKGWIILK